MTGLVRWPTVAAVPTPKRTTLRLDLSLDSEPIEGEVHQAHGSVHPFVGWLGLVSALEHAIGDGDDPATTSEENHAQ